MRPLLFPTVALVTLAFSAPSFAVDRNVTFINQTGHNIEFLGFNPPGDEDWTENEIGAVLENGDDEYVTFNQSDQGCTWTIRIDWVDGGTPVYMSNVDLCTINDITLFYDDGTGQASYTAE
jgi:hypothetical protein